MAKTIHGMNHHIHTAYGNSQQLVSHTTWAAPITGIGQGNSTGPPIWVAISSPMFEIMRQDGFYALLMGTISKQQCTIVGFAFVHDAPFTSGKPHGRQHSKCFDPLGRVVVGDGRSAGPQKCFWYLVNFDFTNNKWTYKQCHQVSGSIPILDTDHCQVTIQCLEPSEACRTLGIQLAPDGNMTTELTYLLDIAKDWQQKMKISKLDQMESIFSLQNVLLRKLVYPLLATTFMQEQCQLMSPILAQGLPLAGFVRTFPHALAHGPLKFCGINIPNFFTEQSLTHIHTIIKFSNQPQDLTGFLLQATGEIMWHKLGWRGQLFEAPTILQDVVTESWMKHTWLATCQANLDMQVDIPDFPRGMAIRN